MTKLLMAMAAGLMLVAAVPAEAAAIEDTSSYCYEHGEDCTGNHYRGGNDDSNRSGNYGGCRGGRGGHHGCW